MTAPAAKAVSPLKAAIVPVTPFQQNCTLIWDEATKIGAVVDPGGDLAAIEDGIAQTGITNREDPADAWPHRSRRRGRRIA